MNAARWHSVERVLQAALKHETAERAAYLDTACPPELRARVDEILRAERQAGDFLEQPILGSGSGPDSNPRQVGVPWDRLGPYKLLRLLGSGGMSSVYLAVRDDEHLHQLVAVKVVHPSSGSGDLSHRFRTERQILAQLEHPNIARVYDGGATGDGGLYLVLEYVAGQPITHYCERHALPLAERLEVFSRVTSAVSYAQRNLIVHRDLKPANILVAENGTPKLLDFGIAKILAAADFPHTVEATATGASPMTLQYASPEQLRGGPITTATDVYALGLMLYELLAGRRAYELVDLSPGEIERVICEQDPPRPSTVLAEAERADARFPVRASQMRGDLDNIVLKALAKDPRQRYGSSRQLAEDLMRFAAGRPVVARTVTWSYRASKFVRRHALAATAAVAFLAMVMIWLAQSSVQAGRLANERDQARLERDRAEQVSSFLVEIFSEVDPSRSRGQSITAREILDQGVHRIDRGLAEQPELQSRLLETMASVYDALGLWDEAIELLERSLENRRRDDADRLGLARMLGRLADLLREKDDYQRADVLLREALAIRRRVGKPELAAGLVQMGNLRVDEGAYDAAEQLYREALAIQIETLGRDHWDTAKTLNDLALVLDNQADRTNAAELYREALATFRRHGGEDHPQVALTLHNLGCLLSSNGDHEAAKAMLTEALERRRKILGSEHPKTTKTLTNLSVVLTQLGQFEAAVPIAREALANRRRIFGSDHHRQVGHSLFVLAYALQKSGELAEAERTYRQALASNRASLPESHPFIAHALAGLGGLLRDADRPLEAEPLLRESLAIRRRALAEGHPLIAGTEIDLGRSLVAARRFAEAEPLLLAGFERLRDQDEKRAQQAALSLAVLYDARREAGRAAEFRALAGAARSRGS